MFKRTICLLLCAVFLFMSVSCSKIKEKTLISFKDQEITDKMFTYLLTLKKTQYLYELYGVDTSKVSDEVEDSEYYWTMLADENGTTLGQTVMNETLQEVKTLLYMADYAVSQGYSITSADKEQITNSLNELVANFTTKAKFNAYWKAYGVDYDIISKVYTLQMLAYKGNYLFFGEGGKFEITGQTTLDYFKQNYITTNHIFINDVNKTYANGKTVYLPDNEKEEKRALAKSIFEQLEAGADFDTLATEYNENYKTVDYKDGYTFAKGQFGLEEYEKAARELKTGKYTMINTPEGIFIIKKLHLNNEAYNDLADDIKNYLEGEKKLELLNASLSDFKTDETLLAGFDVATLPIIK